MRYVDGYPVDPYVDEINKKLIVKKCDEPDCPGVIYIAKHIPTGKLYCVCPEHIVAYRTVQDALDGKAMSFIEAEALGRDYGKSFFDVFTPLTEKELSENDTFITNENR